VITLNVSLLSPEKPSARSFPQIFGATLQMQPTHLSAPSNYLAQANTSFEALHFLTASPTCIPQEAASKTEQPAIA